MLRLKKTSMLALLLIMVGSLCAQAKPLPEWVWKGESFMNKKRTNTTYEFKVFKTEDAYLSRLQEGRFFPLLEYLGERYQTDINRMSLDSLSNGVGQPYTYRISVPTKEGPATVFAQRVDVYSRVDNNVALDPIFEYYQLYAVSQLNGTDVAFDHFERGERSKGKAALMDVVLPGTGQLYKGHTFKGCVILGSEIALGVTAITQQVKAKYYDRMEASDTVAPDSFRNDALARRKIRNAALCAMAGVWAFGIFDALASESMPNITVSAPQGGQLTIAPSSSGAGLALVYRF